VLSGQQTHAQQITKQTLSNADPVKQAAEQRYSQMFAGVDLSLVPSGILYDRGTSFVNLDPLNGSAPNGTRSNMTIFGLAYASLNSMVVDPKGVLPGPQAYRQPTEDITGDSQVIPVLGLHQEYHYIDRNAIANGLFTQSGDNLTDVLPRPTEPYLKKDVFVMVPVVNYINSSDFKLKFDSNLFFTNTGKTIQTLKVDLGDGNGLKKVPFDQEIQASYQTEGVKACQVMVKYTDGSTFYSNFDLFVQPAEQKTLGDAPDLWHYIEPANVPEDPSAGRVGGQINVYLACGRERIEKPFIWAEAFNPQVGAIQAGLNRTSIIERLSHDDGRVYAVGDSVTLWDSLQLSGYDIIILDYDNGSDYLPRTAEFIKEALRWVNLQKHSAGSSAKNIILGQSMGGVCTALALKEMETGVFEDHEVSQFFIFDSPIRGVNIPLSAQACLLDMSFLWVNNPLPWEDDGFLYEFVPVIEDLLHVLYEPATRTMVAVQCEDVIVGGETAPDVVNALLGIDTESLHEDFYSYLHDDLGGLPTLCEVNVITNGSPNGTAGKHNFNAGDLIVKANVDNFVVAAIVAGYFVDKVFEFEAEVFDTEQISGELGLLLWEAGVDVWTDTRMYAMKDVVNFTYYSNYVEVTVFWAGLPIVFNHRIVIEHNGLEIDHAPGGFFGIENKGIIVPDDLGSLTPDVFKMQTWCFTPTGSVLNYVGPYGEDWKDDPMKNYANRTAMLASGYLPGVSTYLSNTETPDFGTPTTYHNTAHTWFTNESSRFMLYHMAGTDEIGGLSNLNAGVTYNYGVTEIGTHTDFETSLPTRTSSVLYQSLVVDNTTLSVNANDRIGLTPSPYLPFELGITKPNSHFVLHIGKMCNYDETVELRIQNNATMVIGDGASRTGSVLVQDHHSIVVQTGGKLIIKEGSTVKLNYGGKLIIRDGGEVILEDGARVIAEDGSTIFYRTGGAFQLNGHNSQLIIDGHLYLFENAEFKPTHVGSPSGHIIIGNADGTIIGEDGSSFIVEGDGDSDPMLTIREHAKLKTTENMSLLRISQCKVLFRNGFDYNIQSWSDFHSYNASFESQSNLELLDTKGAMMLHNNSHISQGNFKDVLLMGDAPEALAGPFVRLMHSDFTNTYITDIYHVDINGGNLLMSNCDFDSYQNIAVLLTGSTSLSSVLSCNFHGTYGYNSTAVISHSHTELLVKNSTFKRGRTGVSKSYGKLTLRCNTFEDFDNTGVFARAAILNMSIEGRAGYNVFSAMKQYNVKVIELESFLLDEGYNLFDDVTPLLPGDPEVPTIQGTIAIDGSTPVVYARKNQWNASNALPDPLEFELTSSTTGNVVNVFAATPMSANCGFHDPAGPLIEYGDGTTSSYLPHIQITGETNAMRLDHAVNQAVSLTMTWSQQQNNHQAISQLEDILMHPYTLQQQNDEAIKYYLDHAYQVMKHSIYENLKEDLQMVAANQSSFDAQVQAYVNVLNNYTQQNVVPGSEYKRRFRLEMDKAHLFRSLGHLNTGLNIIYNIDQCVLDFEEQETLNAWREIYELEQMKQQMGEQAYGPGAVQVNTSVYHQPSQNQITQTFFGSTIINVASVNYRSCSGSKAIEEENDEGLFPLTVFPNPTTGLVSMSYVLPAEGQSELILTAIDGKEVLRVIMNPEQTKRSIDLTHVQNGVYFYQQTLNGRVINSGKLVVLN